MISLRGGEGIGLIQAWPGMTRKCSLRMALETFVAAVDFILRQPISSCDQRDKDLVTLDAKEQKEAYLPSSPFWVLASF